MNRTITPVEGSALDAAEKEGKTLAHIFAFADVVVICDTSGSMGMSDSRGGKRRYDVLLEELAHLQKAQAGRIIVCAFSDTVEWIPSGEPPFYGETTDLCNALKLCKIADTPGRTFFLVSDGEPSEPETAIGIASQYACKINTVFVGPEGNHSGRQYLDEIAQASGGDSTTADRVNELAETVIKQLPPG